MAHIVTERCVKCRYTDCCTVCPVECFYEIEDPPMLVIDPGTCIDCALCVPECPINAIWAEDELPPEYAEWTDKNAELFEAGTTIKTKKDALPGALTLEQLQAREKERGWSIAEPSGAEGGGDEAGEEAPAEAAPVATVPVSEEQILGAVGAGRFKWRSAKGLAQELKGAEAEIQGHLEQLTQNGQLKQFENTNANAPAVYAKS